MKIFLPFKIRDIGGTATFAKKFSSIAKKNGINISSNFSLDFDILFVIADCSLWYPIIAKLLRKKIIQRLDGVYHPATPAGRWYPIYNLKMQIIHNFLADTVIYQSEFSKLSCETFLGTTRAKKTTIIYNGVDTEKIPTKTTPHVEGTPIKLLTFAKFRRRDQIEPIIESVKFLDSQEFTLDIYGSYTKNLTNLFKNLPENVKLQGKKSNEELLQILHQYDIFLFSDQSACPNSVLEAMAAGLPVVAFNRGSIPELIKSDYNGEVTDTPKHDPFGKPYPFSLESYRLFSQNIMKIMDQIETYQAHAERTIAEKFTLEKMTLSYIEAINQKSARS